MRWLIPGEKFDPVYVRTMKVPMSSFGEHSIILNEYIQTPVHLVLKWPKNKKKYYCGYLETQPKRILLLSDIKKDSTISAPKEKQMVSFHTLHKWVVNRCKYQDSPDCQVTHQEWVSRWIIFNLISNKDVWLKKEKERIDMLKNEFDLSNLQKIYPEVKSLDTAVNDMIELYTSNPYIMDVDKMENLLGWIDEYFY